MKRAMPVLRLISYCALCSCLYAEVWQVDLDQYGYLKPPPRGVFPEGSLSISRYVDFDREGNVIVGLVTRGAVQPQQPNKMTPQFASLIWRTLVFDRYERLLARNDIPAGSWHENSLFAAGDGNLLIRTSNKVKLLSSKGKTLAERSLPLVDAAGYNRFWWILPFPNRRFFLLHETVTRERTDEVLDARDLAIVSHCSEDQQIASVSDQFVLSRSYVPSSRVGIPDALRLTIKKFCGELEFALDVNQAESTPFYACLLNDHTVVLAGSAPSIVLNDNGKEQWRDSFDRKHDSVDNRVRADESGTVFAVLVKTWAGGSKFLDINPHLKALTIVVYAAKDGKRLLEVPVMPLPSSVLDFAVSMDGKYLGITFDGELRLIPIPTP